MNTGSFLYQEWRACFVNIPNVEVCYKNTGNMFFARIAVKFDTQA